MPNKGTFNAWSLIGALLGQAAIKSTLAYPESFMKVVDQRYSGLANQLKAADSSSPSSLVQPVQTMVGLLGENGLTVSIHEMTEIVKEIKSNSEKSYRNLSSIVSAVEKFRRVVSQ